MLLVGLTGGIASGKTLISDAFAARGIEIIDADMLAREVVLPGSAGLDALTQRYTQSILSAAGELDRPALREIIFNDPAERRAVDNILHPLIRRLSDQRIKAARQSGRAYVIYVVPLLVETGQTERFDRILVVDVPEAVQIERLMARDGSTESAAMDILSAQATRAERLAIADDVIVNNGQRSDIAARVDDLHGQYLSSQGQGQVQVNKE
jgi:dephospho-CoA kinase